ncbi:MAG: 5'-methylthioadenosine/adenosylhomocysteine nucleosidase [Bacteroidetes bacterium]|nr:5'-methylthioadenosine/adenosylhomocysteine nucleosidase [Bacteroidota bacterium]
MKIGIISAMREEMQELLNELQQTKITTKGKRVYYEGVLFNQEVVLVFSRWGKVAAAVTATQLINDYKLREIIFTGVAGALNKNLNIGDIVVGKTLYQHDMDASPLYQKFEIPLLNKKGFEIVLNNDLVNACVDFVANFNNYIPKEKSEPFEIFNPKHLIGTILSGDQFISSKNKIDKLLIQIPEADCVEMEGAAIAQVCYEYNIPFSIIRIISDKAMDNSHIDFQRFANEIASHYAKAILNIYFSAI